MIKKSMIAMLCIFMICSAFVAEIIYAQGENAPPTAADTQSNIIVEAVKYQYENNVSVVVSIKNNNANGIENVFVTAAVYHNLRVQAVDSESVSCGIVPNGDINIFFSFENGDIQDVIKVFVWSGDGKMIPLCAPAEAVKKATVEYSEIMCNFVTEAKPSQGAANKCSVELDLFKSTSYILAPSVTVIKNDKTTMFEFDKDSVSVVLDDIGLFDNKVKISPDELAEIFSGKLIKYKKNSASQISVIYIADSSPKEKSIFSLCEVSEIASYDITVNKLHINGKEYNVNSDTKVLYLKGGETLSFEYDSAASLRIVGNADEEISYKCDYGIPYEFKSLPCAVYDVDENNNVGEIIVLNIPTYISSLSFMAVIDSIAISRNDEGEEIYLVDFYQDGEIKTAGTTTAMYNDRFFDGAKKGDIYKFAVDSSYSDIIHEASKKVDFEETENENLRDKFKGERGLVGNPPSARFLDSANDKSQAEYFVGGIIVGYDIEAGTIKIISPDTGNVEIFNIENTGIYAYDPEKRPSRRLSVANKSVLEIDKDLMQNNAYVYDKDDRIISVTPAYGMLPYAVVRVCNGSAQEMLVVKAYEYSDYTVGLKIEPTASMKIIDEIGKSPNDESDPVQIIEYYQGEEIKKDIFKFSFDENGDVIKSFPPPREIIKYTE